MIDPGGNKIVPIFKTFDELQSDEDKIVSEYYAEYERANEAFDSAMAKTVMLKKSAPRDDACGGYGRAVKGLRALAKANPSQRATCEQMIADLGEIAMKFRIQLHKSRVELAERQAVADLLQARRDALEKCEGRLFGFRKLAKRSQRFASAQLMR